MDKGDEETLVPAESGGPLHLVVDAEGVHVAKVLPPSGELTIGRATTCDVVVAHRSVSRLHARLRITGSSVEISDAGSANGTRVRHEHVEEGMWEQVRVGDVVQIGDAFAALRKRAPQSKRVWTHGYFEGRVDEEAARSRRTGQAFAVLRLNLSGAELRTEQLEDVFAQTLRSADVLAVYAPGELEMLLVDAAAQEADIVRERLRNRLESLGVRPSFGMAVFPKDGAGSADLLAVANAAVRGQRAERHDEVVLDVSSEAMRRVHATIDRVARGNISVLIQGETGVGKEVCAELVHRRSPRANKTFLRLNCAALSESLLESELFGHERGAFTGAVAAKPGLIETADGGTVFLDEVGELTVPIQVKLLRVLDEKRVLRVGGLHPKPVDVRFVAATNRDLEAEVAAGRFRQDLYFRLAGVTLEIPPLRDRVGEVVALARAFVARFAGDAGLPVLPEISPEACAVLEKYCWPGNVRELRNVVERAVLICDGGPILPGHLPVEKMEATLRQAAPFARSSPVGGEKRVSTEPDATSQSLAVTDGWPVTAVSLPTMPPQPVVLKDELELLEKQRILQALQECGGNQSAAARRLGMSRGTLIARIEAFGVVRPRKGR